MMPGVVELAKKLYGDAEGSHATASEVAVTYALFPEAASRVRNAPLNPEIAPAGDIFDSEDYRRNFPDGRIGSNPALAEASHGEQFMQVAVDELTRLYREFLDI